jgi:magnesium transporter
MQAEQEKILTREDLEQALERKIFKSLRLKFKQLEAVDIAEGIIQLHPEKCLQLFRLVALHKRVEVFARIPFELQETMLAMFRDDEVTFLLNEMEPVDRTQLLEKLPEEMSSKFILRLDPEERQIARRLLAYPEDSVGRIMSPEFLSVRAGMRVSEAIEYIRWNASRYPEELIHQIFVVNAEGKYLGDITLGGLFVSDDASQQVENLVLAAYVALKASDDESVAVDYFRKYEKNIIPVVDEDARLQGVVMADDVFDVAEEEATEDIQQFGGSAILENSYFNTPILTLMRKRAGWLGVLFVGGLWTGHALKYYQEAIISYAFLVIFMPLLISSGGNSGSQAASLIIRGIAVKEMRMTDWYKVFMREAVTGVCLGIFLGAMGYIFAVYTGHEPRVGVIVGLSLVGIVLLGAIVGSMLPFILKLARLDPAVSSSPLIASLVDLMGILIFFNIALHVMNL